jgi:general secretion pathway protein B
MSFILDALKKSESERQRQSGPALFEVKVAQPRGRFAPWAVLLGALLMVNLVIVAWLALRSPRAVRAVPAVASAPAPASPTVTPPPPSSPNAGGTVTAGAGSAPATQGFTVPPASAQVAVPAREPPETGDGTPEAGATADDYAPAVDPPPAGAGKPVGSATRATESGLPTYQDAAAAPGAGIPELRLDLHVFAAKPADRFVFINMVKLREGESLPQGVHVDNITPDGAILSYHGSRFVLMRE